MAAARKNFEIEQGATFDPILTLKETETGDPIDITSWDFRMQIREVDQNGAVIVELTVSNSRIVILDASGGKFQLVITDTITDTFTEAQFESAVYDLEAIESGGAVRRLLEGNVTLSLNITR